jgi:protein involved in polysaccharide export with SLBB domain
MRCTIRNAPGHPLASASGCVPRDMRLSRPWHARWCRIAAILVVASAVAAPARSQTPATSPPADTATRADTSARPTGTLRSGDLLKIRVYRDSELSGQYLIDAQGNVQMPGVGVIRAAGLDPTQITERMIEAFRARGFRTPEIAIQPLIRVSVLGEVRAPGLYPVEPGVSLIQLLTLAGGPSDHANLKKAQVIRENHVFTVDLESALAGSAAGRVTLYSNDVVYLPPRHNPFSRDNIALAATLAGLALTVVTLIEVTHH